MRNKTIPLEEKVRKLDAEKEGLELANDQLNNDISYWRTRLHSLVSRYNDIDPQEHQQLVAKFNDVTASLATANEKLKELENEKEKLVTDLAAATASTTAEQEKSKRAEEEYKATLTAKDNEITSLKATAEGASKNADNLREKLRQFNAKLKEANKTNTDYEQQITEATTKHADATKAHETKISSLEQQLAESQAKVSVLSAQVESLTKAAAASLSVAETATISAADAAPAIVPAVTRTPGQAAKGVKVNAKKRPLPTESTDTATVTAESVVAATSSVTNAIPVPSAEETKAETPVKSDAPSAASVAVQKTNSKLKQSILKKQALKAAESSAAAAPVTTESTQRPPEPATEPPVKRMKLETVEEQPPAKTEEEPSVAEDVQPVATFAEENSIESSSICAPPAKAESNEAAMDEERNEEEPSGQEKESEKSEQPQEPIQPKKSNPFSMNNSNPFATATLGQQPFPTKTDTGFGIFGTKPAAAPAAPAADSAQAKEADSAVEEKEVATGFPAFKPSGGALFGASSVPSSSANIGLFGTPSPFATTMSATNAFSGGSLFQTSSSKPNPFAAAAQATSGAGGIPGFSSSITSTTQAGKPSLFGMFAQPATTSSDSADGKKTMNPFASVFTPSTTAAVTNVSASEEQKSPENPFAAATSSNKPVVGLFGSTATATTGFSGFSFGAPALSAQNFPTEANTESEAPMEEDEAEHVDESENVEEM